MRVRFWQSLSFRLALAYAGLLCLSMALVSAAYYWIAIARPSEAIKADLNRDAQRLAQIYIVDGEDALISALDERKKKPAPRQAFHTFLAPDGRLVTGNLPSWPKTPRKGWFSIEADIYRDGDEQDFSALSRDTVFRNNARLIVGRDAEDIEDREEVIVIALPWLFGLTLLFGITGGLLMSRTIGHRLGLISAAARQVIAGDLASRVAIRGSGDDFDRLALTLNAMLARNQDLFEAVRRVSDNVAHELRTPLARLVARLEALERTSSDPANQADIEAAIAEADRLQSIFNALLRIARIEEGRHDSIRRKIDLAVLATDAGELYRPVAEARAITLDVEVVPETFVEADPDLLFQATANLLDNALKFTPSGGTVRITVQRRDKDVILTVADTGPGLQPSETQRITERFFRGSAAQGVPGEGLGLSLVSAIARLHGAVLSAEDNRPGLAMSLRLAAA